VPTLRYAVVCRAILAAADDRGTTVDEIQEDDLLEHLSRADLPGSVVLATAKRSEIMTWSGIVPRCSCPVRWRR
jgi:hypothetical protein